MICSSHVQLFETPWTVVHQAPLSMEFSRQEYWNGLSFLTPEDLPDTGIQAESPVYLVLAHMLFTPEPPGKPYVYDPSQTSVNNL